MEQYRGSDFSLLGDPQESGRVLFRRSQSSPGRGRHSQIAAGTGRQGGRELAVAEFGGVARVFRRSRFRRSSSGVIRSSDAALPGRASARAVADERQRHPVPSRLDRQLDTDISREPSELSYRPSWRLAQPESDRQDDRDASDGRLVSARRQRPVETV